MNKPSQTQNDEAVMRVQKALDLVQSAQNLLGEALCDLSTVTNGGYPVWKAGSRLHRDVHSYWYRINKLLEGTRRDRIGVDYISPETK